MWEAIRKAGHFYDKLELMPGAKEMFGRIWDRYGDRCEILTGIPKPKRNIKDADTDKAQWMRRYFGPDIKVNIVFREEKKNFCHGEGDILIDDYKKNINEWVCFGGTGILFADVESAVNELHRMEIL